MTGEGGQAPAEKKRVGTRHALGAEDKSAASKVQSAPIPWSAPAGILTEGPRWHAERGELLWVDILGCTLHRGRPVPDGSLESR